MKSTIESSCSEKVYESLTYFVFNAVMIFLNLCEWPAARVHVESIDWLLGCASVSYFVLLLWFLLFTLHEWAGVKELIMRQFFCPPGSSAASVLSPNMGLSSRATVASSIIAAASAQNQSSCSQQPPGTPGGSTGASANSSPRPSILRKRNFDGWVASGITGKVCNLLWLSVPGRLTLGLAKHALLCHTAN
jgi:hypothetical protein